MKKATPRIGVHAGLTLPCNARSALRGEQREAERRKTSEKERVRRVRGMRGVIGSGDGTERNEGIEVGIHTDLD